METLRQRVLVLAGGLGTRLQSVVADRPKVLAPVAGRPFLDVLTAELHARGVRRIGLLLGHLHEQVERHVAGPLARAFPDINFVCSVEPAPLGTAGALRHAAKLIDATTLVINGDTYLALDPAGLVAAHRAARSLVTIATRSVADRARYGGLDVAADGRVRGFVEKGAGGPGPINAGAYVIEPRLLELIPAGRSVSLETEVFPRLLAAAVPILAVPQEGDFIDIGTPESYQELETLLGKARP